MNQNSPFKPTKPAFSQRTDVIDNKTYRTFEGALSAGISKVLEPFKEYFNGKN